MFPKSIPDRTITVLATPRPLRLVVILDANAGTAISDFEETASYFGRLWGGRYNAITLSHGGELQNGWKRVLQLVDADCIYSVSPLNGETVDWINETCSPAVFRNGDRVVRLQNEHLHVFSVIRETPATLTSIPSDIAARTSTLFSPRFFYVHGPAGEDPYKRFILHNLGTLSEEVSTKDAFRGTDMVDHNLANADPHALLTTLADYGVSSRFTPDMLSASHASHVPGSGGMYDHRFTLVVGDTVADLALYRAIKMFESIQPGRRCAWISPTLLARADVITLVRTWITNSYWTNTNYKAVQIISLSEDGPGLTSLATSLSEGGQLAARVAPVPAEDLGLPVPQNAFVPAHMRQGIPGPGQAPKTTAYQCGLVDGVGMLDAKPPSFLRQDGREEIMLDLEIPYLRNEPTATLARTGGQCVWRLPQRQGLAGAFLPQSRLSRIERHGLPTGVLRGQDLTTIRIPTAELMFHCCISNDFINEQDIAGHRQRRFRKWHPSDEGQFLAALVDLFGSPYGCGYILGHPFWGPMLRELAVGPDTVSDVTMPSMRRALALYAEQEGAIDLATEEGLARATRFLAQHARASSRKQRGYRKKDIRDAFFRFKRETPQEHWYWTGADWKGYGLDHELDERVRSDVLRMGIQHRCDACGTDQWIPTDGVRSQLNCSGCGACQSLGAEPVWRYQVNTLAAEAIRRRGVVTVVQALYDAERNPTALPFAAMPSVDIYDDDSNQPFTDLDLVYFANMEFVIGEVKADPTGFLETDLNKIRDVAADLRPNRVVIAAPQGEWPRNIEALFERYATEQGARGILWEKRNLEW